MAIVKHIKAFAARHPGLVAGYLFFILVTTAVSVFGFTRANALLTTFINSGAQKNALLVVVALVLITITIHVCNFAADYAENIMGPLFYVSVVDSTMDDVLEANKTQFLDVHPLTYQNYLDVSAHSSYVVFSAVMQKYVPHFVLIGAVMVYLTYIDWRYGLVFAGGCALLGLAMYFNKDKTIQETAGVENKTHSAELFVYDVLNCLNTVVASNKSNDEHAQAIDKLDDAARNRVQLQHSLDFFNYLITGFVSVLGMVVVLLAVLQLGSDSKSRSSNPTNILTVLGLVAFLQTRLTSIGSTNIAVATECGRNSAHNIPQQEDKEEEEEVLSAQQQELLSSEHALLKTPSKTFAELCASFSDSSSDSTTDSTTSTCKMQVSFSQVSFSFPGYPLLLNAFSWTMSPGVNVLRAPSGSGKTTLAKLLMRMLTATSGSISINGTNIYDLDPAVLRTCICFTNQDMGVLNRPLRELLAYGTQATEDQVVSTWMQFSDMFTGLELADFAGVDGRNLSTGQKQIVRLHNLQLSSAPVVIADEPCSGLDPKHRQRAIEVLRRIGASGKTLLVITHEEDVAALADNLKEVTSFSE